MCVTDQSLEISVPHPAQSRFFHVDDSCSSIASSCRTTAASCVAFNTSFLPTISAQSIRWASSLADARVAHVSRENRARKGFGAVDLSAREGHLGIPDGASKGPSAL